MEVGKKSLARYACTPRLSRGRLYKEDESIDDIFLNDRQKVIHSSSFRRLEYKTQVFVNHVGDHYRTRLTHTIEVSQIARILARKLALDEDLAETVALSHDLGHPPFGHAGEEGLNIAAHAHGGFDHNTHTIKIVTLLEQRSPYFTGLNLSYEALDGIAKHNGPLHPDMNPHHNACIGFLSWSGIAPAAYPSLEAQCASLADDIAYINHDIDDGLRAGMFTLQELEDLPIVGEVLRSLSSLKSTHTYIKHEVIKLCARKMLENVVEQTVQNISSNRIKGFEDVIECNVQLVDFSEEMKVAKERIKGFLMAKVYRNYRVNRMTNKAKDLICKLFNYYLQNPHCLPDEWYARVVSAVEGDSRCVIDYIAGMTDRFAIDEHKRLFDPNLF